MQLNNTGWNLPRFSHTISKLAECDPPPINVDYPDAAIPEGKSLKNKWNGNKNAWKTKKIVVYYSLILEFESVVCLITSA